MFFFFFCLSLSLDDEPSFNDILYAYLGLNESYIEVISDLVSFLKDDQIQELSNSIFEASASDDPIDLALIYYANVSAFYSIRESDGKTPFMISCENEKMINARFINLNNINATEEMDYNNKTALDYALENKSYPVIAYHLAFPFSMLYLDDTYTDQNKMLFYCYLGNFTGLLFLNESSYDVNHEDAKGRTPLILAVIGSNLRIIRYLIDKGANINYIHKLQMYTRELNQTEMSVLDYALLINDVDVITYLQTEGAITAKEYRRRYHNSENEL